MSNIVLYACLFEITCITPSGKGHDPLDDKKNMNTSYTMYTLKSKLLKKHTLLHINIMTRVRISTFNGHSKKLQSLILCTDTLSLCRI